MKAVEWTKEGYWKTDLCEKLLKDCPDEIERIDYDDVSAEDFIAKYESQDKPVVIKGLTRNWNVEKHWSWEVF